MRSLIIIEVTMRSTTFSLAAALLLLAPAAGLAQETDTAGPHQGFWIGFGLGGGTNFADFADGARAGVGGYVRMGGTISQQFLVGGELIGWGRNRGGNTFSESGATAVALFYPMQRGIFLKGGVGFAAWAAQPATGGSTQTAGGFAGTLGLGYDLQIGSTLYLTPNLDFLYHTMESEGTAFAGVASGAVLLFTLGLTWY